MSERKFSSGILRRFAETVSAELGADQFRVILGISNLPAEWAQPGSFSSMSPEAAAKAYGNLQSAIRTHYGRGARGILLRAGQRLWHHLLQDSGLTGKAQAAVIKRLPLSTRRKPALDLLAKILGYRSGDIAIHLLDQDLLFVDHASPTADGARDSNPICYTTQGLIRECLFWATSQSFDVEEIACKAQEHHVCEFKITSGK